MTPHGQMRLGDLIALIDKELRKDSWFFLQWTNTEVHLLKQEQFKAYTIDELLPLCAFWQETNGKDGVPGPHIDEAYPVPTGNGFEADWDTIKAKSALPAEIWDRMDWDRIRKNYETVLRLRATGGTEV